MNEFEELAERVRELALSFPEAYEDEPWGHPVFKVAENRMFASMSVEEDCVSLTVKLTAEEREIAYLLPFVHRARYVGHTISFSGEIQDSRWTPLVMLPIGMRSSGSCGHSLRHIARAT